MTDLMERPRAATSDQQPNPGDLLKRMSADTYRRAFERGMSLTAWLETEHQDDEYHDGMTVFERMLESADIRTTGVPYLGIFASEFGDFDKHDYTRALVPEWVATQIRKVVTPPPPPTEQRATYLSTDNTPGGVLAPYFDAAEAVVNRIVPAIPVNELVAQTVGIRGDTYRAFYLTDVTAQERMALVAEGAELPRIKLTGGDHTITLSKNGRIIEISYEQLRRTPIDIVALHLAQMAAQQEADRVATAIAILALGDGNTGTAATTYNLTTLDTAATAGTLTLKGWLAYKMKFANPYTLTTALTTEASALAVELLNTGSANIPLVVIQGGAGFGGVRPINPGLADNVALGWTSDAYTLKVVGFDRRFAILRLVEIGSDINETVKFAERQTNGVAISQVEGFATLQPAAVRILDINA